MAVSGDYAVSCSYQFSRDELHNKEEIVEQNKTIRRSSKSELLASLILNRENYNANNSRAQGLTLDPAELDQWLENNIN